MNVIVKSLLCFLLLIQTIAIAQDTASTVSDIGNITRGISKVSGIDIIVVEEALTSLAYDAELQELNLVSEHTSLKLENWSEAWLVALAGLLAPENGDGIQPLSLEAPTNIIMKSQSQFRMSGPFETIELYEKSIDSNDRDDSNKLAEEDFLLFIGNDIPLKWNWLAEFEGKIKASGVLEGGLELTYNSQTYLVAPNEVTPLADNFCTYVMALNESQTSDIMGSKTSEWRFDVALFKCADPTPVL